MTPAETNTPAKAPPPGYRAGFVAILGKPNAGKSTLVNTLVGEKLLAVSGLPQTTRDRIQAFYSRDDMQIVFVDLPGLVQATDKLNEALRENILETLEGVDCVVHLVDVTDDDPVGADMADVLSRVRRPVILAVNKLDTRPPSFDMVAWMHERLAPVVDVGRYAATLGISGSRGTRTTVLVECIRQFLPEGVPLYDPEDLTDRDMRFLAAEIIREKIFLLTHQEVPYSTAVTIEDFKEREFGKWYVAAQIHLERDSQKGILIGHNGAMLKKISHAARVDIEKMTGMPIFLELHIRVTKDWRKNEARLREFGYGHRKKNVRRR